MRKALLFAPCPLHNRSDAVCCVVLQEARDRSACGFGRVGKEQLTTKNEILETKMGTSIIVIKIYHFHKNI